MVETTTLYDAFGRPIKKQALVGETQTARTVHLHQEFADHPSRGLTPAKLARILVEAEQGQLISQARLAEDMEEKDGHLFSELSKRRRAILGVDWDLIPPRDASAKEKEDTSRIEEMIREMDWEEIIYDAAAAILYGYSNQEIEWDRSDGEWRMKDVSFRPADWFMCAVDNRETLLLRDMSGMGEALRPWGWISHIAKAKSGYITRAGLCRVLAWPFLFRNYSARDMAEFLEIYGLPLRLGKYPSGSDEAEKATLMRAVIGIGHAAAGIIPEGMQIEFKEAAKGVSDPFMAMINWAEATVSKAILGGTLTSQTGADGGGAYALGEVHNEVRHDILESDIRQISKTLTRQLVQPLVRLNTTMDRMPRWTFNREQPEDITAYSEALPKLVGVGMKIPVKWAHSKLAIPEPEKDEPVLAVAAPAAVPAGGNFGAVAAARAEVADVEGSQGMVDQWADRLETETQAAWGSLMEPVRRLVASARTLDEIRERMADLYEAMPDDQLTKIMQTAIAAARLAGLDDAVDEEDE